MTTGRALENRIVQQLLQHGSSRAGKPRRRLSERLIATLGVITGLAVLGSYLEALLWLILLGSMALVIGTK